ncbi:MAG TPA: hypothetical protein VFN67_39840 [Polyangiales bacterium]|nr:hypothetical protein [Polyangiales bacterium]
MPKVADVSAAAGPHRLVLALGMLSALACRNSQADSTQEPGVSAASGQVKPAEARPAPAEAAEAIAEPSQEPAELPRGVSAPQPDARDVARASNTESQVAVPKAPAKPKPAAAAPAASKQPTLPQPTTQLAAKPTLPKPAPPTPARVPSSTAPVKARQPASEPPPAVEPVAPAPPPPPPPPPPAPKVSVIVPHTDHVRVDVPAGLQHWLDEDDRMRPWLGKAVSVADGCYAKVRADEPNAAGVITLAVTMHENARPSGSVSSVSGPLNSIIMCATRGLFSVKMPLFTGTEGESYSVRVRFDP